LASSDPDSPNTRLAAPEKSSTDAARPLFCTNCGAAVSGRYCSACGQSIEYHLHSLRDFLGEAMEVLTHADSRLWRTLRSLLLQPGFLTQQFLQGRRARYLPPLRLYFVLSVLFFLIVSVTSPVTIISKRADRGAGQAASDRAATADLCSASVAQLPGPDWLRRPFLSACRRTHADQNRALGQSFVRDLGRAMFLFLPLLAGFMTLLYSRAGARYVDNLLLLVHNQALVYLLMAVYLVAMHWMRSGVSTRLLSLAVMGYLMFYFFRSMQRVYAQKLLPTLIKFIAIALAYLLCAVCMVFLTALYAVETQ